MALSAKALKAIPQRYKDLAFGYLRQHESKYKMHYPQPVKYLCLIYSIPKDEFDPFCTNKALTHVGYCILSNSDTSSSDHEVRNSYLRNIVSTGVHVWRFKYHQLVKNNTYNIRAPRYCMIGIWKTVYGPPSLTGDISNTSLMYIPTGYGINMCGFKSYGVSCGLLQGKTAKNGDVIEMKLDFNELRLTYYMIYDGFKLFNEKFENIEDTSYRAVVSVCSKGYGFSLISYQEFYK